MYTAPVSRKNTPPSQSTLMARTCSTHKLVVRAVRSCLFHLVHRHHATLPLHYRYTTVARCSSSTALFNGLPTTARIRKRLPASSESHRRRRCRPGGSRASAPPATATCDAPPDPAMVKLRKRRPLARAVHIHIYMVDTFMARVSYANLTRTAH